MGNLYRNGFIVCANSRDSLFIMLDADEKEFVKIKCIHNSRCRRIVKKNDYENTFSNVYVSAGQFLTALKYLDDENFNAFCNHYLGLKNFYERG